MRSRQLLHQCISVWYNFHHQWISTLSRCSSVTHAACNGLHSSLTHSLTDAFFSSAQQQQLISLLCLHFCSVSLFSGKDDKIGALWRSVSLIPAGTRKHIDPTLLAFLLQSWKFNPNDRWDEETLCGSSSTTKRQKWEICVLSRNTGFE